MRRTALRLFLMLLAGLSCVACLRTPVAEAAPARTLPAAAPAKPHGMPVRQVELPVSPRYPVWLEADGVRTEQTSGLAFVERAPDGAALFFSCDDIGALHRIELREADRPPTGTTGQGWMTIAPIAIPDELRAQFGTGPVKLDLEEVAWTNTQPAAMRPAAMISIEGNLTAAEAAAGSHAHEGRIEMIAIDFDAPFAQATRLTRVTPFFQSLVQPAWDHGWDAPWEGYATRDTMPVAGMEPNRGFEGVAMGGFRERPGLAAIYTEMWFAPEMAYPDDPRIPAAWQGTLPIFHSIQDGDTKEFTLRAQYLPERTLLTSVCGLHLMPDGSALFILDRNLQRIHRVALDLEGTFTVVETARLRLLGPSGEPYFTPSLESLTIDDRGYLYAIVDPWKYTPLPREDQTLSADDIARYRALVPMLYRFDPWPTS